MSAISVENPAGTRSRSPCHPHTMPSSTEMTWSWNAFSGPSKTQRPSGATTPSGSTTGGRNGNNLQFASDASLCVGHANSVYWYPKPRLPSDRPSACRADGSNAGHPCDGVANEPVVRPSIAASAAIVNTTSGWSACARIDSCTLPPSITTESSRWSMTVSGCGWPPIVKRPGPNQSAVPNSTRTAPSSMETASPPAAERRIGATAGNHKRRVHNPVTSPRARVLPERLDRLPSLAGDASSGLGHARPRPRRVATHVGGAHGTGSARRAAGHRSHR